MRKVRIIALYNIKGGVGKTATAVNLAYLCSLRGARTILLDLDPQGSATYYFRIRPSAKFGPRKFLAGGTRMARKIRGTDYPNLDLLPAAMSLRKLDVALGRLKRSKRRLGKTLETLAGEYNYAFLDCPPNITLVAENVFRAAEFIIIPCVPTVLSVLSYEKVVEFFEENKLDKTKLVPFFSMAEPRKRIHRDIMQRIGNSKGPFLRTVIPYLSDIERMGVDRNPVVSSKPASKAAERYRELWSEVERLMARAAINNRR